MSGETKIKLHLGCGRRYLPGYLHVDIQTYPHIDIIHDIRSKLSNDIIAPESIEEIYACHVLEHIPRQHIVETLIEWHSLLKYGGKLRLAVPDFEAIVEVYLKDKNSLHSCLLGLLYGGQRDQWDYHTLGFDMVNITRLLEQVGFAHIERYNWQEFLPQDYDDYSRCYLPHGDNINGRLMSLNVIATKSQPPPLDDTSLLAIITKSSPISSSR